MIKLQSKQLIASACVCSFLLAVLSMNKAEWLNTNEVVVEVLKRLGETLIVLPQSNHRARRRLCVCVYGGKRTDRETRVCANLQCVFACVTKGERAGDRKGGGDKEGNRYKREGGDEGMV